MDADPYQNFLTVIKRKSKKTQENYIWALQRFMKDNFIEEYSFLLEGESKAQEDRIIEYIQTKKYSHANILISALRLFYAANRKVMDWDHVLLFLPTDDQKRTLKPRVKADIEAILNQADEREQNAVLVMATGGARVGALETLTIEDTVWLDEPQLYCIKPYPGTDSEYLTFITPQASKKLKKLIGSRKKGPIFLSKRGEGWPADAKALTESIRYVIKKLGLDDSDVQLNHGFRKFFRTTLETSGVHDDFAERLLGHKKEKLKKVYSQPQPMELYKASDYSKAIDALTFNLH